MTEHGFWYQTVQFFARGVFYSTVSAFLCLMMAGWNPIAYLLAVL